MAAHVTIMPIVSTTKDPSPVLAKMDLQGMEQFVLVTYYLHTSGVCFFFSTLFWFCLHLT